MPALISKEDFARITSSSPELSVTAYNTCPVRCSTCFEWCVSTIRKEECRRYDDLKAYFEKFNECAQKDGDPK